MNNKVDDRGYPIIGISKSWPDDNKTIEFTKIAGPVRDALQIALDKGDRVYEDGIEWTGLKQGKKYPLVHPDRTLHSVNLKKNKDVFADIINIAIQLGMEQGERIVREQLSDYRFMFSSDTGKEMLNNILGTNND